MLPQNVTEKANEAEMLVTASQSTPTFAVQQHLQFPLPQVFQNQAELLSLARQSAADGYLTPDAIPFLGHTNQEITFKKVRWALHTLAT